MEWLLIIPLIGFVVVLMHASNGAQPTWMWVRQSRLNLQKKQTLDRLNGGFFYSRTNVLHGDKHMYALKHIKTTPDGRSIEENRFLGDLYQLEFYPKGAKENVAAHLTYNTGSYPNDSRPCVVIMKNEEAYITTLSGDTVRVISRGVKSSMDVVPN